LQQFITLNNKNIEEITKTISDKIFKAYVFEEIVKAYLKAE